MIINNMLDNFIINILGKKGAGKTLFSTAFALSRNYKTIICNFNLKIRGKNIIKINEIYDLFELEELKTREKKLIIFDEMGIMANAREAMSKTNRLYGQFSFISRKYWVDIVNIAQYQRTIDINLRQNSDFILFLQKKIINGQYFIDIDKYIVDAWTGKQYLSNVYTFDAGQYIESYLNTGIVKYNTEEKDNFEVKIKQKVIEIKEKNKIPNLKIKI